MNYDCSSCNSSPSSLFQTVASDVSLDATVWGLAANMLSRSAYTRRRQIHCTARITEARKPPLVLTDHKYMGHLSLSAGWELSSEWDGSEIVAVPSSSWVPLYTDCWPDEDMQWSVSSVILEWNIFLYLMGNCTPLGVIHQHSLWGTFQHISISFIIFLSRPFDACCFVCCCIWFVFNTSFILYPVAFSQIFCLFVCFLFFVVVVVQNWRCASCNMQVFFECIVFWQNDFRPGITVTIEWAWWWELSSVYHNRSWRCVSVLAHCYGGLRRQVLQWHKHNRSWRCAVAVLALCCHTAVILLDKELKKRYCRHWGNLWETVRSAYGLFRAHRYHL